MESIAIHYLTLWRPLGYILVFFGMVLEGDAVLFTAAFLAHRGFFDPGDIAITLMAGVLLGDSLWYEFGLRVHDSFLGNWFARLARRFDDHLKKRPLRTIFISKFIYGIHHPILMRAGALKIPLKNFIKIDFQAAALWIILVGGLGYLSSASFSLIKHYLRFVEVGLLLGLLLLFFLEYLAVKRLQKKL